MVIGCCTTSTIDQFSHTHCTLWDDLIDMSSYIVTSKQISLTLIFRQSQHYIGISSDILHSLCKFAPRRIFIIAKPKVYNFNFALLSVTFTVLPDPLQNRKFNLKLYSKWVPICHIFGITQNTLESNRNGSSWNLEVNKISMMWYNFCLVAQKLPLLNVPFQQFCPPSLFTNILLQEFCPPSPLVNIPLQRSLSCTLPFKACQLHLTQ